MLKKITQQRWPVVIIGAGPVGMLLALLLARRKIHSLLIEKRMGNLEWSKAIGITPPSLAILAKVEMDRTFITHGVKVTEAVVHDDSGIAGEVHFDRLASAYPFILVLPQSKTLEILGNALAANPYVEYRRGVDLVKVRQTGGVVEVGLQATGGGGAMTLQAEWLIGCDGSKSTVRNLLNIDSARKTYPTRFVMGDFGENTRWGRQAHLFFTKHGALESFPLPSDKRRWVASITKTVGRQTLEQFLVDQTARISGVQLKGSLDSPLFEFQPERMDVTRLYCGRVILAGDAAHVMSPIGGQGMNTGLADADLLAEALPNLLADDRSPTWLNHYDKTRRRAARSATRRAAAGMWVGTRISTPASVIRSTAFRRLLLRPPLLQRLPPHFAMLTIPDGRKGLK